MTTDELVLALAGDLEPVRRLPSPGRRTLRFCAAALPLVALFLAVHGLRADWQRKLGETAFLREQAALLTFFTLSTWAALRSCVPGRDNWFVTALPAASLGVWLAFIASRHPGAHELGPSGVNCVVRMAAVALVPFAALTAALRRAPPLERGRAWALAVWSVTALGGFATQWLCTRDNAAHVLVWHAAPVVLAGLGALGCGAFRRRSA